MFSRACVRFLFCRTGRARGRGYHVWLVAWLFGRSIGWSVAIGWSVDFTADPSIGCPNMYGNAMNGPLTRCLTYRSNDWLIDRFNGWFIDLAGLMDGSVRPLILLADLLLRWRTGTLTG